MTLFSASSFLFSPSSWEYLNVKSFFSFCDDWSDRIAFSSSCLWCKLISSIWLQQNIENSKSCFIEIEKENLKTVSDLQFDLDALRVWFVSSLQRTIHCICQALCRDFPDTNLTDFASGVVQTRRRLFVWIGEQLK